MRPAISSNPNMLFFSFYKKKKIHSLMCVVHNLIVTAVIKFFLKIFCVIDSPFLRQDTKYGRKKRAIEHINQNSDKQIINWD